MRTTSALTAATFCALALSGSVFALDRKEGPTSAPTPGWLEFRAAFAAEGLWPGKVFTTKFGHDQSPDEDGDTLWPVALEDTANAARQRGPNVLRNWGRTAAWALTNERSSFNIAGN
jgi:hypothetical protein